MMVDDLRQHVVGWEESLSARNDEASSWSRVSETHAVVMPPAYQKKMPAATEVLVVDFFAGCGGMSYGFANTRQSHLGYKVLAGIDINAEALRTYQANITDALAIQADILELAEKPEMLVSRVPQLLERNERPLVFIGCAPCQGFSAHRKKDPRDDRRNNLMLAFAKLCQHFRPEAVIMENVPEILSGRYSHYYADARKLLRKSGYNVREGVLDLSLFGVPQRRRRAIVLAALDGTIELPRPIFKRNDAPTVRMAIQHLRPIAAGEVDPNDKLHRAPAHIPRILERIKKTPVDGGDRRALESHDQLDCHASVDRSATPGFTDVYGRLRWDSPSVTITAKSSTPSCGRFLHPEQHRNISAREAAILQGFPQTFQFLGSFIGQYRQIGEAVPPSFSRALAWHVLDHFRPKSSELKDCVAFVHNRQKPEFPEATALRVVDGFCGSGGIALGFRMAGYGSAFAFDLDPDAVATFRQNISTSAHQADVRDRALRIVIPEAVAEHPFVLAGGPPCQGFSQQRRGAHEDSRNDLVEAFSDLVVELPTRPVAVVLENVTYLDSPRGRKILESYQQRLRSLGYVLFRHDINSAEFGVPQLRKRIILVAVSEELAGHYEPPIGVAAARWPTVGEMLVGLPRPETKESILGNHTLSGEGELNRRRLAFVDMGMGRMSIPPDLQLPCHLKYGGHLDVFGRLDWYSQARTITGGFDSFTRGEYGHPFEHRSITAREAARIQGFPDWFQFHGNRASVRRQIGNAVPPPVAQAIASAIKNAYAHVVAR